MGACVGMKGTRVQSIIRELRGEKIDIVEWNDDATDVRGQRPLSGQGEPRQRSSTKSSGSWKSWSRTSSSRLAIGKKGQNVRLAAKLVGWRIDIKSEEEKRQEVEAEMARMAAHRRRAAQPGAARREREDRRRSSSTPAWPALAHILEMTDEDLQHDRRRSGTRRRRRSAKPPPSPRWSGTRRTPRKRRASRRSASSPSGWPRSRRRKSGAWPRSRPWPSRPRPRRRTSRRRAPQPRSGVGDGVGADETWPATQSVADGSQGGKTDGER